jgi:hypothetical protein
LKGSKLQNLNIYRFLFKIRLDDGSVDAVVVDGVLDVVGGVGSVDADVVVAVVAADVILK